jgi:hypothetical protein
MVNRFIDFGLDKLIIGRFIGQNRFSTSASLKFEFRPVFDQYYQFSQISMKPMVINIRPHIDIAILAPMHAMQEVSDYISDCKLEQDNNSSINYMT